jgi:hypothetical protein
MSCFSCKYDDMYVLHKLQTKYMPNAQQAERWRVKQTFVNPTL